MSRLALLLFFGLRVLAIPQIALPVDNQIPPVARVLEPYDFQFSSSTFTTSQGPLTFAIQNAPSWLQLNSNDRTFSGTPSAKDVGLFTFSLVASDSDGSTTTQVTLAAVNASGPQPGAGISAQLASSGALSTPTTLSFYPSENFNIDFATDTFIGGQDLSYYAISGDRSPLPSWIKFNASAIAFSGLTPPLVTWPQTFDFKLIASDIPGFAGAAVDFALVISNHQFVFEPWQQVVEVNNDTKISFNLLESQLKIDGQPAVAGNIQQATANSPDWLTFDPNTLSLTGTAPPDIVWQNVTVSVQDQYGDVAEALVKFHFPSQSHSPLFKGQIGVLTATIGKPFQYTISRSILASPNDQITVNLGAAATWLQFNSTSLELRGTVPGTLNPVDIKASITAHSTTFQTSASLPFKIHVVAAATRTSSTNSRSHSTTGTPTSSSSTSSQTTSQSQSSTSGGASGLSNGDIVSTIVLPILLGLIGLMIAVLFCLKKRHGLSKVSSEERKLTIEGPLQPDDPRLYGSGPDPEMGYAVSTEYPGQAPRIETPRLGDDLRSSKYRQSGSSFLAEGEAVILESFAGSSMGYGKARDSGKYPARATSKKVTLDKSRRHDSQRSTQSRKSGGVPVAHRLTGVGHGRGSPTSFNKGLSAWAAKRSRGHSSGDSSGTPSTGILYEAASPSYFPAPPWRNRPSTSFTIHEEDKRRSIRMVVSPDHYDGRPIFEKRRSYLRKRPSAANPFFAGDSRASSVSKPGGGIGRGSGSFASNMSSVAQRHRSSTLSNSQSSSTEPLARNPQRLSSTAYREHMATVYPRVVREHSGNSVNSADPWETMESSSNYGADEEDIFEDVTDDEQASKTSRKSPRPSRLSKNQVIETGKASKAIRPRPGMTKRTPVSSANRGPKLVDVTGGRPVSVDKSTVPQLQQEQSAEVGQTEFALTRGDFPSSASDDGPAFV